MTQAAHPGALNQDNRVIVGIGDAREAVRTGRLVTYGLGSCIAVCAYHPSSQLGALCHYLLPTPSVVGGDSGHDPLTFGSACVPALFDLLCKHGVSPLHCHFAIVGGAVRYGDRDHFATGERNIALARALLAYKNITPSVEEVGGHYSRTVSLDVQSGVFLIQSPERPVLTYDWKI